MKLKRNVILTSPANFLNNPTECSFILSAVDYNNDIDWMHCGEIEFDVDIDSGKIIEAATANIDAEIGKHTAAINVLENRKSELLALTHDGNDNA